MLGLVLGILLQPVLDPAPRIAPPVLERALGALDAERWIVRETAQAELAMAPTAQLLALWDRARRGELSASQRARLRAAILAAPRRGGAVCLAEVELGAPVFPAPAADEEGRFRAWIAAFPERGDLDQRRAANACWDACGEEALFFLERTSEERPERARWSEAASRRLRLKLFQCIE